ncbi:MAG: CBS domain-containing protein [Thermotaleaceae bacterium]
MNLTAEDIMTKDFHAVDEDSSVHEAIERLLDSDINCLPVVDGEESLKGIVTETDLLYVDKKLNPSDYYAYGEPYVPINTRILNENLNELRSLRISEVMTEKVVTVKLDTPLIQILDIIVNQAIKTIPVVEEGKLLGIVTRRNILKYYL